MAAQSLCHAQRVTRLYRNSLKHMLSWTIDRQTWRKQALELRMKFDEHKDEKDRNKAIQLLEDGEDEFNFLKHPDPYICKHTEIMIKYHHNNSMCIAIAPEAPEGSKWERNLPPPPWVCMSSIMHSCTSYIKDCPVVSVIMNSLDSRYTGSVTDSLASSQFGGKV